jgi:hypothetical protein
LSNTPDGPTIEQRRSQQRETLETVVTSLLGDGTHGEAELREKIDQFRHAAGPDLTEDDIDLITRILTQRLLIDVELGVALTSSDFEPWLPGKMHSLSWERWLNYKHWLLKQKRPPKVVDKMDELTDDILDLVGDPSIEGSWARRGLVIGDVQSGKTSTYMALFNKAADAGYRLIIVLAGSTELLRQQTQQRVDEGFIGRDSRLNVPRAGVSASPNRYIGIGLLDKTLARANGMTTVMRDFRKSSFEATNIQVSSTSPEPYVFVVKKNKSVLTALASWLDQQPRNQGRLDIPVLLLDDESDYASVNTREDTNPTAINAGIRGVLDRFSRSSYLAFTATPFANIFIDHDNTNDLFPRDFVYALESPTNYVGAAKTFGTLDDSTSGTVIDLDDADGHFPAGHKSTHNVDSLPNSLHEAIRAFFIGNALRDLRQDSTGRAMLVNVSRFKHVQRLVFELVDAEVTALRNAIDLHARAYAKGSPNTTLDAVRDTFTRMYSDVEFDWSEVLPTLRNAVNGIRVELYNSDRDKKLVDEETTWDRPPRLIAIGGDVLSRGLTLDGLMISYFYRRVGATDTLMQMARWLGYRDGYADLCRVWIDPGVAADYRFVDESVAELRRDLALMKKQRLTPSDFGLAIKKHPGSLLVTARNKMKSAAVDKKAVSLAGRRIESTKLPSDLADLRDNEEAFEDFLGRVTDLAGAGGVVGSHIGRHNLWRGVPKEIVADFLASFKADRSDAILSQQAIGNFVRMSQTPHLQTWDVVLMNGTETPANKRRVGQVQFWAPKRAVTLGSGGEIRVSGSSSKLAGRDDLSALLSPTAKAEAIAEFTADAKNAGAAVPESAFYSSLESPALLLYPLIPRIARIDPGQESDRQRKLKSLEKQLDGSLIVALKIAIPGSPVNVRDKSGDVEYVINTVAQRTWLVEFQQDADEDDLDG